MEPAVPLGYFFVDRILGAARDGALIRARGMRAVTGRDPFPGWPGAAGLGPCFAAEAVGQLAAWVSMAECGFRRRPVAGLTAEARVHGAALPGEVVILEAEIESIEEDAVHYHGRALAGGRLLVELRDVVGPMLPMEEFDDPAAVERAYGRLLRHGEAPAAVPCPGQPAAADSPDGAMAAVLRHPAVDRVLEMSPERMVAAACVARLAPYLAGHFPRKPVLPSTLLLDGQVAMALALVGGQGDPFRVDLLRHLKMREFIGPGATVISEVRIAARREGRILLDLLGRVEGRVVSSAEAEMVRGDGDAAGPIPRSREADHDS